MTELQVALAISTRPMERPTDEHGSGISPNSVGRRRPGRFAESSQSGRPSPTYLDGVLPSGPGPAQSGRPGPKYVKTHAGSVFAVV